MQLWSLEWWTIITGGVATLAIFSFLIRENAFYRFFEHLFIGIAAGLGTILGFKTFLWPQVLVPLFGLDIVQFPDGSTSAPYNPYNLLFIAPLLFGLLYYCIYSQRLSWLAKLVIGFSLGASGGLAFKGFFNEMVPQFTGSFKPLLVYGEGGLNLFESISNTVFVLTLLTVMYYFFFSFKAESKTSQGVRVAGRWLMMVCFGAFFGSTVMARMALLVERLQFLLNDWRTALTQLVA